MLTGLQKIVEDKRLIPGGTTLQETSSFEKWIRNTKVRKTSSAVYLLRCLSSLNKIRSPSSG